MDMAHIFLDEIDFYFITDSHLTRKGTVEDVEAALRAGCRIIQYREKEKSTLKMVEEARALKELCKGKAIFLVNDRLDVALAVDADGVHIGQDDMPFETARRLLGPRKIIGLTVHNLGEALDAQNQGADYIGLSAIYSTTTKKDAGAGQGPNLIRKVKPSVSIPVVVIGGIKKVHVPELVAAGADAIVAISAVLQVENVEDAVKEFRDMMMAERQGAHLPEPEKQ